MRFPLVADGALVNPAPAPDATDAATHVILCNSLFEDTIGAACGGPAEDALVGDRALLDRFEAAPGRWVSVYR